MKVASFICTKYKILPTDKRFKDLIQDPLLLNWVVSVTQEEDQKQIELWQKTLGVLWTKDQFNTTNSKAIKDKIIIPLAVAINPDVTKEVKNILSKSGSNTNMTKNDFKTAQQQLQNMVNNEG